MGSKRDPSWVWVALDADSRPVVARAAGDRSADTARRLRAARPAEYRDEATVCTDVGSASVAVVPSDRHAAGGKDAGLTAHVERFGWTLRQRCSRFVRKAPSFSKCVENHVGALGSFIRYDNASLR